MESGVGKKEKGRRDGTGSPCERSQESLRRATPGPVVSGRNLSLTRMLSDDLGCVCVSALSWCVRHWTGVYAFVCAVRCRGRQGPSAALTWLTAICVALSSRSYNSERTVRG